MIWERERARKNVETQVYTDRYKDKIYIIN